MLVERVSPQVEPLVVITGASSGLGRSMAAAFCRRGVPVVGFGRSEAMLAQAAEIIADPLFTPMQVDVGNEGEVVAAFRTIRAGRGDPSILINNAAVYPHRDIMEETGASYMQTLSVNLGGVVYCSRAALETMTVQGSGRIINVGSFAGQAPAPSSSAYSVSKGAARIFSQALVSDLGDRFPNIIINTWMPGVLNTRMGLSNGLDPDVVAEWGVALALMSDRTLNGAEFDRDLELVRPRSTKRRLLDAVLRRRAAPPRRLVGQTS